MQIPLISSHAFGPVRTTLSEIASPAITERAWRSVGLAPDILDGPAIFLPYHLQAGLIEQAAREMGERHLGVHLAKRYTYSDIGPYANYVLQAPRLDLALIRGTRALPFILTHSRVMLREEDSYIVLQFASGIQTVVGGQQIDEGIIFVLADLIRSFMGSNWQPDWIELTTPRPEGVSALEELFGAKIVFDAEFPAISIAKQDISTHNTRPNSVTSSMVRDDILRLSASRPPRTFADWVIDTLKAKLAGGDTSEEAICACIGLGVRTMQRRLRKEGTSFRDIRSQVLNGRAQALLAETDLSVADIAAGLDFDEVNSFRRAFQGWTNVTPTQFRERLGTVVVGVS